MYGVVFLTSYGKGIHSNFTFANSDSMTVICYDKLELTITDWNGSS